MIDSHCHLTDKKFADDLPQVLDRARRAGVGHLITIADSLPESEQSIALCHAYPEMSCTVGVHPHNVRKWHKGDREHLTRLATSDDCVRAIGEIGLDYHYEFSPRDVQQGVFRLQLELAKELNLPVVSHNRESIKDLLEIIEDVRPTKLVLHCCTERFADIEPLLGWGYLLSFTGIATYADAEDVRETIRRCPLERMMIETDAPYLAPVPHRGRRNEPAFVREIAKFIADIKGVSLEELDHITTNNTVEFFGLKSRVRRPPEAM